MHIVKDDYLILFASCSVQYINFCYPVFSLFGLVTAPFSPEKRASSVFFYDVTDDSRILKQFHKNDLEM